MTSKIRPAATSAKSIKTNFVPATGPESKNRCGVFLQIQRNWVQAVNVNTKIDTWFIFIHIYVFRYIQIKI